MIAQELTECLPRWFPGAVDWSVELANHGPRWLPVKLRCAPLWGAYLIARLTVAAPGVWGYPPWKRSAAGPALRCWNTSGDLAESPADVWPAVKTQPNDFTRHAKPDPALGGSAGTQDPSPLCTNERISQ